MKLYELTLHFPNTYGALGHEGLTLKNTEYYESDEQAKERAIEIANSFVTPKPDYYYLEDGGFNVWTNSPEQTKEAIHYDLLSSKPTIKPIKRCFNFFYE